MLIVGLGNPGLKYHWTRHNAGALALDALRQHWQCTDFVHNKKTQALVSIGRLGRHKVILARPESFMNESGVSVQKLLHFFKVPVSKLVVLHDDKDLPLQTIRLKPYGKESGSGGQNGVHSVIQHVGTSSFARIKIGVANDTLHKKDTADFVLEKFTATERALLPDIFEAVAQAAETLLKPAK